MKTKHNPDITETITEQICKAKFTGDSDDSTLANEIIAFVNASPLPWNVRHAALFRAVARMVLHGMQPHDRAVGALTMALLIETRRIMAEVDDTKPRYEK